MSKEPQRHLRTPKLNRFTARGLALSRRMESALDDLLDLGRVHTAQAQTVKSPGHPCVSSTASRYYDDMGAINGSTEIGCGKFDWS